MARTAARPSIFLEKQGATKALSVKIPERLLDRINSIQEQISNHDDTLTFCYNSICLDSLQDACETAEKELAAMFKDNRTGQIDQRSISAVAEIVND